MTLHAWKISFQILTQSLEDPSFGLTWLHIPNIVLHCKTLPCHRFLTNSKHPNRYIFGSARHVFSVSHGKFCHCFTLDLLTICHRQGNRPQGSNKTFTTAVVIFALITIYMAVSMFYGVVRRAQKNLYWQFAAIFLAVKGITNVEDAIREQGDKITVGDVFANRSELFTVRSMWKS